MEVHERTEPEPSRPESGRASLVTGPSSKLPTFLLIGAMKAGTTSLYHYLRSHPQVFMPEVKEVMFFDPRHDWHRGIEWYEAQFAAAEDRHLARGEASTSYTKFPVVQGVPARIASVLPEVRLLYVVRHPVERMQSHYLYLLSRGKESRPIDRAFDEEPMYLDTSRYALQLEQYEPYIRPEQLLLIDSRDLRDRRVETLARIFAFLGVDATWVPPTVDREFFRSADRRMRPALSRAVRRMPGLAAVARRAPRSLRTLARRMPGAPVEVQRAELSTDLRRRLEEALASDVARLRRFMPQDFDGWGID